ncbi:Transmembrane domain-containing protein [Mimivirus argentum]|uniref:Uncharacterized protein n=1 Tax=Mimivirus sp. 'lentille' TaxID=1128146 RepID=H6WBD4_9VIRU|nr:hypothetical protein tv_L2 [Mimivirus lentille]AEY99254.1 hypothetical protein tv_L2 [Acanthamoeba castellanii mamavirus]UMZ08534.1 Transmembrane domain-containing protein [Mimivirus argentum]
MDSETYYGIKYVADEVGKSLSLKWGLIFIAILIIVLLFVTFLVLYWTKKYDNILKLIVNNRQETSINGNSLSNLVEERPEMSNIDYSLSNIDYSLSNLVKKRNETYKPGNLLSKTVNNSPELSNTNNNYLYGSDGSLYRI